MQSLSKHTPHHTSKEKEQATIVCSVIGMLLRKNHSIHLKNVSKKAINHNLGTWDVPLLRLFVTIIKWLHPISCLYLSSWPTYSVSKHQTLPSLFSTLSHPLTHPSEEVITSPIWLHALGVGPSRQKHMPKIVDSNVSLP